jgi:predicted  nucleic acid-binding Zn ribbon protein
MSNKVLSLLKRKERKANRCPKCESYDVVSTEYPDAFLLICNACKFPRRVKKK